MATVDGGIVELLSEDVGFGVGTHGRFVTIDGSAVLLEQAVQGDVFVIRARDSGEPGIVWMVWLSENIESDPLEPFTGPLVERTVLRILPRRGALPILADNGETLLV
jgi:hypothetical protein